MKPLIAPLAIVILDAAICAAAVVAGGRRPERYFDEGTFTTWLNGMQLVALGTLSLAAYLVQRAKLSPYRRGARLWLLIALGGILLSVDDVFQYHESIGGYIEEVLGIPKVAATKYNDIIALGYIPIALAACWIYRGELLRDRRVLGFFVAGALLLGFSQAIDSFGWFGWRDHVLWVPEESSKILGFGAILGGVLLHFQRTLAAVLEHASWSGSAAGSTAGDEAPVGPVA